MRDIWLDIAGRPEHQVRSLADVLERRGEEPGQTRIREDWLDLLDVRSGQTVLDVGAGTGVVARAIARRVAPEGRVIALDPSPVLLEQARAFAEREGLGEYVETREGTAEAHGIPPGSVDAIVAATVFMHLERPRQALQSLLPALRPGGVLSVFDQDYATLVFDHPDIATTEQVVRAVVASREDGRAGRHLFGWLVDLGLRDPAARTFSYAEAGRASYLLTLAERGAETAVRQGWIDGRAAEAWLEDLRGSDRRGGFFGSLTYVAAWGHAPG